MARKVGLPTIIGYMLGGILIGPFTPGYVSQGENISQLAELGVIFLMFGVGLHFSISDLWKVRGIAIPGAIGQMTLSTIIGVAVATHWGWSLSAGVLLGLSISIATTVVLLRGLIDNGLLNTQHGQTAIGWLVLEDLATVFILLFLPIMNTSSAGLNWGEIGWVLVKATGFIVIALFLGKRFIPWFINQIAHTRSYELFILTILGISLGTAIAAAQLFGISLALGAFIAGILVKESPLNHQVGADLAPFREAFAVLFFVSIGMLVDPLYIVQNLPIILILCAIIVIGKLIITLLLGLVLKWPIKTSLIVAIGLSQIGEFSFILGQAGIKAGLLSGEQYSLLLASALITITINPILYKLINPIEQWLHKHPRLLSWFVVSKQNGLVESPSLKGHVVIVGYGRVGRHIANVLNKIEIPVLIIDTDLEVIEELTKQKTPAFYGDAANSEILKFAELSSARAMVIARPDEIANELVVVAAHEYAPDLPIIARASTTEGIQRLITLGAKHVVHPEMEGGLELVQFTLAQLGFPGYEIFKYSEAVRKDNYDLEINSDNEVRILADLLRAVNNADLTWITIPEINDIAGQTIQQANLRARTGASIVAINRNKQILPNPKSQTILESGDRLGLIGDEQQIEAVKRALNVN